MGTVDYLNPLEAAEYLRIHRETLYTLIRNKTIKASKLGGRWRIPKASLDEYMQQGMAMAPDSTSNGGSFPAATADRAAGNGLEKTRTSKILVVDDSPQIRELFEVALVRRGHTVTTVPDGYEAIERVKKEVYDVIFIDLVMPGLDGVQTLEAIRNIDPDPMVVLITGFPDGELVTKALGMGPFVVLGKPIRISDLLKVIEG